MKAPFFHPSLILDLRICPASNTLCRNFFPYQAEMAKTFALDRYDRAILALLQRDASISLAQLSEKTNLSTTPCWRRVQRLEERGIIRRRVALLDAAKINVGTTVFV